ncbi:MULTISPECIES: A/G-specific adenine glycosylase [Chromobacterium]|uniref:A/G-specific adenine glycosylase n=1 Tax=Chromobacterium TaxID=535 RepID=UPI0018C02AD6|nr:MULTISPECIES: A/G-specific adenine glycosylase [Chromobacterium]QOZ85901.1 A/G-specific adenine glycosylase [Chromobacterium sp. Rain0013]WON86080.1 A/G-specific adenine glycosylase [Chromobacterium haemolyticum]
MHSSFAARLTAWQKMHGRHDLPWQVSDPYRIWLSEIMLQQTQVKSVLEYYPRFLARFPDVAALAAAPQEDVLTLWSGLGYYSRARNLHKAAQMVMAEFGGRFPTERLQLERLPGVGRSTAAAIASFAFGRRETILDGNVKRVLTRCFGVAGFPGEKAVEQRLWCLAETLLPQDEALMSAYTQGLMDLGATVCSRGKPACTVCPMVDGCVAAREGRTGELPTPRPKKAVPTRHTVMLLATHEDKVWLQRRPPSGIWGGLLSLPEFETSTQAEDWLQRAGQGDALPAWPELEHVFTHYRLIITPLPARLDGLNGGAAMEDNGQWLPLAEAPDAGVPAPVRRLLLRLAE